MITVFLPCRLGSQRVPDKNIRNFAGIEGGLLRIKLDQLCKVNSIDSIILSSNDARVLDFAAKYSDSRLVLDERPDELGRSTTTTDELIQYVPKIIREGDILWTHVTSPFFNDLDYEQVIKCYYEKIKTGYDSLMTVFKVQGFIWNKNGPLNYNREPLNWPMTQNLEPLYEVDSAVFLSNLESYINYNDRIGQRPFLFEQDKNKSIDIDWPEDFTFAEKLWTKL